MVQRPPRPTARLSPLATMNQRQKATAVAVGGSLLALLALAGQSRLSGPVLVKFSDTHGLHLGDAVVLAVWVGVLLLCRDLARRDD